MTSSKFLLSVAEFLQQKRLSSLDYTCLVFSMVIHSKARLLERFFNQSHFRMDATNRRARKIFKIPSYLGVHKSQLERQIKTRRDKALHSQEAFRNYSEYINKESNVAGYFDSKWSQSPASKEGFTSSVHKIIRN